MGNGPPTGSATKDCAYMDALIYISIFLFGAAAGAVMGWLVLRANAAREYQRGRGEGDTQLATLAERLAGRDAASEELKSKIQETDASLREAGRQITDLTAKASRLETALQEERRQALEKLALLEEAKDKLTDAFKALAADSLKNSNTSFLELAKTQFEKFQESSTLR